MIKFIKRMSFTVIILILLVVGIFLYAHFVEPDLLVTTRQQISSASSQTGRKIKLITFSDTHFGKDYQESNLDRIVQKINQEEPDVVVFCGDLMDSYYRDSPDVSYIQNQLSKIQAKYGKFAVYGNHDYGGGAMRVYQDIMTNSGFSVLKNENILLDELKISLAGLDDYSLGKPDSKAVHNIPDGFYQILISHAPDLVDTLDIGDTDLVLSGHTHGGQIALPFLRDLELPPGGQKYIKGLYPLNNEQSTQLYVTSGVGTTQAKLRLFNSPEIVVLNINY